MTDWTYEVCIPTLGNVDAALAALIPHAANEPFPIRLWTPRPPATTGIVDILSRLGCPVTIEIQEAQGIGNARGGLIATARTPVQIQMDDDTALVPVGALPQLVRLLDKTAAAFVSPVIRNVDHQEWLYVGTGTTIPIKGREWLRHYDIGHNQTTPALNGTCVAFRPDDASDLDVLDNWPKHLGSEDGWLGGILCRNTGTLGVIASGIYAYHWGHYLPDEWNVGTVESYLARHNPDAYADTLEIIEADAGGTS